MIQLQHLLAECGLDPKTVVILLHTPKDVPGKPSLRRMLPSMVREQSAVFETYQSSHNSLATKTLRNRPFVASFVVMEDSTLLLAGVYERKRLHDRLIEDVRKDKNVQSLWNTYGAYEEIEDGKTTSLLWFDLELTDHMADYRGRLRIKAKKLTQTYARLAETFKGEIVAVEREDALVAHAPDWNEFIVTAKQVKSLPHSWANRLREWRGVYLIVDTRDGNRYVGCAYGQDENLLGRWRAHVAREKGVTVELGKRDPSSFQFSILELVAKSAGKDVVLPLEQTWMIRLGTRRADGWGGLNY